MYFANSADPDEMSHYAISEGLDETAFYMQSCKNFYLSHTQSMDVEGDSDQKLDL